MVSRESLIKLIDERISLFQTIPDLLTNLESYTIKVGDNPKNVLNEITNLKIQKKPTYIISAKLKKELLDFNEIKNKYKTLKNNHFNEYYHISKINKNHFNTNNEITLYVGSKQKSLSSRLSQHLGLIDKNKRSVYSLYLNDWWDYRGDITIMIITCKLLISNAQLQVIEDLYWDELLPYFGKKGANTNSEI